MGQRRGGWCTRWQRPGRDGFMDRHASRSPGSNFGTVSRGLHWGPVQEMSQITGIFSITGGHWSLFHCFLSLLLNELVSDLLEQHFSIIL